MIQSASDLQKTIDRRKMASYFPEKHLIERCVAITNRFPQSADDLLNRLEAFLINNNRDALTSDSMGKFEMYLHQEHQKAQHVVPEVLGKRAAPAATSATKSLAQKIAKTTPSSAPSTQTADGNTPSGTTKSLETSFSQVAGVSYAKRGNSGQVVQSHNVNLGMRGDFVDSQLRPIGMRCRVTSNTDDFDNVQQRYRYMFTTLEERAKALDRHLLHLQTEMCQLANIDETTLQPVGMPSQDSVWVCGRIFCEAAEGKLNKSSIVLEGSRKDSGGRRVQLDVSELPSFSFFPGQILLVEGINSSGRKMIAKKVIDGAAKPALTSPVSKVLDFHHSTMFQGGKALNVITACGPFTTSDNLNYQPFEDLLGRVLVSKPDVLILVGPFVDISQPLLSSGDVLLANADITDEQKETLVPDSTNSHHASYEMVFVEKIVRDGFQGLFNSEDDYGVVPTNIILVPSLQDAHHEFVFPQPPFGDRDSIHTSYFEDDLGVLNIPFSKPTDPKRRIHLLPNPCMFRVNEMLFGVCSNDVLFSLSSEEISQNLEGNRLARLAGHILCQQSFCPQFPVPPSTLSQFDLRHSRHWEFKVNPDVMILPSRLAPLAKDVMGTLVINPGTLAKGVSGGTFAEMAVHPIEEKKLKEHSPADQVKNEVSQRACVNILRI